MNHAPYDGHAFSTSPITPTSYWPGDSKVFKMTLNGSTVGWLEVENGSSPEMMWWSNGNALSASREIDMIVGDKLNFQPGSLPEGLLYPLDKVQTPL